MFVQLIEGKVRDSATARARLDAWLETVAPISIGWLGSTSGVTDDGRLVSLARFESADAAARNSDLPEQGAWWRDTEEVFDGEPTFLDSERVLVNTMGDPSAAGFVQVMRGRTTDVERSLAIFEGMRSLPSRPDMLGQLLLARHDGRWVTALYFTSEAEARVGEKSEPPPQVAAALEELQALEDGEPTFYDLKDPWLDAPAAS